MPSQLDPRLKGLRFPPGFRLMRDSDGNQRIRSGEQLMDQYQPSDYLEWTKDPGHFVVVRVIRQKVVALLHLFAEGGAYLLLDMLNVDQEFRGQAIGSALILIADDVARHLSITELRLEALNPGLIGYYQRFGYERSGTPVSYPGWGEVYPMRKRLS